MTKDSWVFVHVTVVELQQIYLLQSPDISSVSLPNRPRT